MIFNLTLWLVPEVSGPCGTRYFLNMILEDSSGYVLTVEQKGGWRVNRTDEFHNKTQVRSVFVATLPRT